MGDDRRELEARLARLGPERLAAELLELANHDREIARRMELLSNEEDPRALATELKRRIGGLQRSSRFGHYCESFELAKQLRTLLRAAGAPPAQPHEHRPPVSSDLRRHS